MASLLASKSEKLELQSMNIKFDSERNSSEMFVLYDQFKSCLHQFQSSLDLFQQQAPLMLSEPFAAEDLGERAMILAQFYPEELAKFPTEIVKFLESSARSLPSDFRVQLTQALILLNNRKIIGIAETLEVFMELQTLGDRALQQLAFSHVIQSIKNDPNNKALQNILCGMLQQEDAAKAKRALITLCDLHRKKVWSDDRTANAICMACFHPSSRIMIAALSFLLDFEKIQDYDSENEADQATPQPQIVLNKEAMYKTSHKGTTSSKKKKAKLQRIARSMKNQQQLSSEKINTNYCSPLNHLKDAQEFSEKLFSRLQSSSNGRLAVKMMMIKVIARTVGLHHLILLDFYPYLQKYVQTHERDATTLLAAAVHACHEMVPPDAVKSLFKQIVNQFVFDQSRPEALTAGLNVVREICLRMPLLMTEELLQDLVLYTKSHEKAVSVSARLLFTLFRELCPSLLVKKDIGRPAELKAKPKAFGEVHVPSNIPGVELLEEEDQGSTDEDIDGKDSQEDDSVDLVEGYERGESDGGGSIGSDCELDDGSHKDDEISDDEDDVNYSVYGATSEIGDEEGSEENDGSDEYDDSIRKDADVDSNKSKEKKRKLSVFEGQLNDGNISLRALKKLMGTAINGKAKSNSMRSAIGEFSRWNYKVLRLTKKEKLAFTSRGLDPDNMTTCAIKRIGRKILGEKRQRITGKRWQELATNRRSNRNVLGNNPV